MVEGWKSKGAIHFETLKPFRIFRIPDSPPPPTLRPPATRIDLSVYHHLVRLSFICARVKCYISGISFFVAVQAESSFAASSLPPTFLEKTPSCATALS